MDKDYFLFDFQFIIKKLKEKHKENEEFNKMIEGINDNSIIENMDFYKDYLSRFDVEQLFKGFCLTAIEETDATKDDLLLLFRLIAGSFSSSYDILYDKTSNSVDFSITVESGEQSITKSIAELFSFQIQKLFEIYVDEMINLCITYFEEDELEEFETERRMRLVDFDVKIQQVRKQVQNQQDSKKILSDLDELLNS